MSAAPPWPMQGPVGDDAARDLCALLTPEERAHIWTTYTSHVSAARRQSAQRRVPGPAEQHDGRWFDARES